MSKNYKIWIHTIILVHIPMYIYNYMSNYKTRTHTIIKHSLTEFYNYKTRIHTIKKHGYIQS